MPSLQVSNGLFMPPSPRIDPFCPSVLDIVVVKEPFANLHCNN